MTEKELLKKLAQIVRYSRRLPIPESEKEEFISYCSLQLVTGRTTRPEFFFVDFVRKNLGRRKTPESSFINRYNSFVSFDMDTFSIQCETEQDIVDRMTSRQVVSRMLHTLGYADRAIVEFIYFDDLTARDVAKIFCVTESAISMQVKKILKKLKDRFLVAESSI